LGTAALLVVLYYTVPLGRRSDAYVLVELLIGVTLFAGMIAWELRAIVRANYPAIRAAQSLASTAALFLLLFAATYYVLGLGDTEAFSEPLSRSDALYFTITVFATVGFGDISPVAETTRLLAAGQMLLDLVVLGLGIQVLLGAVHRGRKDGGDRDT
jgi:hypothetical protein